jgi:hypothetical protein
MGIPSELLNTITNVGNGGTSLYGNADNPNVFKSVPKLRDPSMDHIAAATNN